MQDNAGFDYQADTRKTPPDPARINRGPAARVAQTIHRCGSDFVAILWLKVFVSLQG
jgi:hypothetical protein